MSQPVTLVLLPALDGTGIFFEPLLEQLPPWVRPRVLKYPEHGPHDYARLCARIEAELQGEGSYHVLGWSFGGPLALMLAARQPDRVRSVILCASFATCPIPVLKPLRWCLRSPLVGLARTLWRSRLLLPRVASTRFRAAKKHTWLSVSSRALAARGRAIMTVDLRAALRQQRAPLLYIAGMRDRVVRTRSLQEIQACKADARVAYLSGDHYALFSEAHSAAGHICGFIGSD